MKNKPFRLKDPKTGLYYCPSREVRVKWKDRSYNIKSNLSKTGKVYFKSYDDNRRYIVDHTELIDRGSMYYPACKGTSRTVDFEVEYLD